MPFNQVVVTWKSPRQQATTYKYIFIRPPPHYAARNAGNIQLKLVYLIKIATASFMSAWREKKSLWMRLTAYLFCCCLCRCSCNKWISCWMCAYRCLFVLFDFAFALLWFRFLLMLHPYERDHIAKKAWKTERRKYASFPKNHSFGFVVRSEMKSTHQSH